MLSRIALDFLSSACWLDTLVADLSVAADERKWRARLRICFDGDRLGDS